MLTKQQTAILRAALDGGIPLDRVAEHLGSSAEMIRRRAQALLDRTLDDVAAPQSTAAIVPDPGGQNGFPGNGIARACAEFVVDGSMLFLGAGSVNVAVAGALHGRHQLVLTNGLDVAQQLKNNETCDVVVISGALRRSDRAIVGEAAVEFIGRFQADYAIVEASAVADDGAILGFDYVDVGVTRAFIANSRRTIIALVSPADRTSTSVRIADVNEVNCIVTSGELPPAVLLCCHSNGVDVIVLEGRAHSPG